MMNDNLELVAVDVSYACVESNRYCKYVQFGQYNVSQVLKLIFII